MKTLLLAATFLFSLTTFATDLQTAQIDDLSLIPLGNSSSQLRYLSYPGMGQGRSDQPDCLVFVTEKHFYAGEKVNVLRKLADKLFVADGSHILFAQNNHPDVANLPLEVINGQVVFKFTDLGKYLTGVLVKTKSGKSFEHEIRSVFEEEAGFVGLQMSRACKITD